MLRKAFASLRGLGPLLMVMLALVLALPVLVVLGSWFHWTPNSWELLRQMVSTVLPDYAATSLMLCLLVALGVTVLGLATAATVTLFRFPGRGAFEWLLLLPLAMPAYVVAYAYTDMLQWSGPLQAVLREMTGWQGALWPDVRSLWGAALVFTVSLYPYVYLLARTALLEHATTLMEAARLLGAPLSRRLREIALPLARPAVAAGVALALMETLADFGVSSYFGIQTFTAGIYKAWLALDDRLAAAQLSTALLLVVVLLLQLEQHARRRLRFSPGRPSRSGSAEAQPVHLQGRYRLLAWTVCAVPVMLGFGVPVVILLHALWAETADMAWTRFADWALNSLRLSGLTALLAVSVALVLAFSHRQRPGFWHRSVTQLVGLGYAVPGAVVVVGLLLPLGWVQQTWPALEVSAGITGTALGLVWAYLVRFCAVALQSVQSGYARMAPSLDESARLLGVTGWRLWWQVHAPLLRPTTLAAVLLVFVDVMKELPATLVLRPFNSDTLAVVAYQLARDERLGEAALPSLALVLVGLLPVILLSRTLRRPAH
ncbi:MAG: ABC transporter permease [Limnohabitans sp.]